MGQTFPPFLAMPGFWKYLFLQPIPYSQGVWWAGGKMRGMLEDTWDWFFL